jgi:hypothetical protein
MLKTTYPLLNNVPTRPIKRRKPIEKLFLTIVVSGQAQVLYVSSYRKIREGSN